VRDLRRRWDRLLSPLLPKQSLDSEDRPVFVWNVISDPKDVAIVTSVIGLPMACTPKRLRKVENKEQLIYCVTGDARGARLLL